MDEVETEAVAQSQEDLLKSEQDALRWIKQVGGTVYHNRKDAEGENAWIAVVRTPSVNGKTGKIIMSFGDSIQQAATAAEDQWNSLWSAMGPQH